LEFRAVKNLSSVTTFGPLASAPKGDAMRVAVAEPVHRD
jgi:hypothetical protein